MTRRRRRPAMSPISKPPRRGRFGKEGTFNWLLASKAIAARIRQRIAPFYPRLARGAMHDALRRLHLLQPRQGQADRGCLQSVIQKLGKPWYKRRALRVFRDDTSLSATPHLWPTIEQALGQSRFLVLLASPEAAASHWVGKEVAYWLEAKSAETLLIAVTDGVLDLGTTRRRFLWADDRRCRQH